MANSTVTLSEWGRWPRAAGAGCCPLCAVQLHRVAGTLRTHCKGRRGFQIHRNKMKTVFPKSRKPQISNVPLRPLRIVFRFLSSPCVGSETGQPVRVSVQRPAFKTIFLNTAGGGQTHRPKKVDLSSSVWNRGSIRIPRQSNLKAFKSDPSTT